MHFMTIYTVISNTSHRGNDNFAGNLSKSRLADAWTKETIYNPHPGNFAANLLKITQLGFGTNTSFVERHTETLESLEIV